MAAKIQSIYFHNYSKPSMSVSISTGAGDSASFTIKDDDMDKMQALIWTIIERKKYEMAESIIHLETPVALQAPESKTIEGE